ncbi:MAG: hypothetical protein WA705_19875 [Candidatus Ozemobacteraceae bacterium]
MKQLTFKLPDDKARVFRVLAAQDDLTMTGLLLKWIKEHTPALVEPREFTQTEVDSWVAADNPPAEDLAEWLRKA